LFVLIVSPKLDYKAALTFFRDIFVQVAPLRNLSRYTCATDTECLKRVFIDIWSHILQGHIKDVIV